jgi:hypothetical protein
LDEKFRAFCNILYEFTYPEPEPGLKDWAPAPAPPKSGRSTGSGSATLRVPVSDFISGFDLAVRIFNKTKSGA